MIRGLDVLKRHQVDWNVLTTIHAVNGGHGRVVYTFLRDELGATFIQFIPIIERATSRRCPSPTPAGALASRDARCTSRKGAWSPTGRWARSSTAGS